MAATLSWKYRNILVAYPYEDLSACEMSVEQRAVIHHRHSKQFLNRIGLHRNDFPRALEGKGD